MARAETPAQAPARTSPSAPERGRRTWARVVLIAVVVLALLVAALATWLGSESGLRFVLARAQAVLAGSGQSLAVDGARGSIYAGVAFDELRWHSGGTTVRARQVSSRWSLAALARRRIVIDSMEAAEIDVATGPPAPSAPTDTPMPGSFASPVDITLGRLSIGRLRVGPDETPSDDDLVLTDIAASASYEAATWRVGSLSIVTPFGRLDPGRLSIGAEAPHPIDGRLEFAGRVDRYGYEAAVGFTGDLNRLQAQIDGTVQRQPIAVRAALSPLSVMPLVSASAKLAGTDLRALRPDLPVTRIDATVSIAPDGSGGPGGTTDAWRGEFSLDNREPGAIDTERVPVESLRGSLRAIAPGQADRQRFVVDDLVLRLGGRGEIDGSIDVTPGDPITVAGTPLPAIVAALKLRSIDLSRLSSGLPATALGGRIDVTREAFVVDLAQDEAAMRSLMPSALSRAAGAASVRARGTVDAHDVRLQRAEIELGRTRVQARGRVSVDSPVRLALDGDAAGVVPRQWLPASVADDPRLADAIINGRWSIDGTVSPSVDARLDLVLNDSRLAGQPLAATIATRLTTRAGGNDARVADTTIDLRLGRNRLNATGALGRAGDELTLHADLPQPQVIEPTLRGTIDADATLGGRLDALNARVGLRARGLAIAQPGGDVSIGRLRVDATVPPLDSTRAPIALDLSADTIALPGQRIDKVRTTVDGTLDAHRFALSGSAGGRSVQASGTGHATMGTSPSWQATLEAARLDGPETVELRSPAAIAIRPDRAAVDRLRLALAGGDADVDELVVRWGDAVSFSSRGALRALAVTELIALAGVDASVDELAPMRLSATWQLAGSGPEDLTGRVDASLVEQPTPGKPALGIEGDNALRIGLDRGRIDGNVDLSLPSLAFTHRLTAPDWVVDGRLRLTGRIAGTTTRPALDAKLDGSELRVLQRSLAWRFTNGEVAARFSGRQMTLETLRFDSDDGTIAAQGSASMVERARGAANGLPVDARFTIRAERMLAPLGPGQRMRVSGDTTITSDATRVAVTGALRVDRGIIELQGSNVPGLPDDVEVVGLPDQAAARPVPAAKDPKRAGNALRIASDIDVALGDELRITGRGVEGRITGMLEVGGFLPDEPSITGTLKIVDGRYRAYGQNLVVERGDVRFNGPVDNPTLDIVAKRPMLPVEVGVAVTGTARTPTVTLTSKPDMPDSAKLSWLVLGVAPTEAQNAAQWLALRQAAAQLLGTDDGPAKPGVAERLGLDVFNFGYGSDAGGPAQAITENRAPTGLPGAGGTGATTGASAAQREVVTVGKRLSDRLFVTYERGVRGLWNLLRIQYKLTQRLSVRGQSGSDTAIDLSYSYSFD